MTPEQLTEARKIAAISPPGSGVALLVAQIDAQAAEIERLEGALTEIHGQFVHGSRKLYATPDKTLDSIRATAANALKEAK